jgi:chromosome segregation ATPase
MDLGTIGLALSVLAGLGAAATWLTVGGMRGRVRNLSESNEELRKEVDDEKRRHDETRRELAAERKLREELQVRVEALADLPLTAITATLQGISDQLAGHHEAAMIRVDKVKEDTAALLRLAGNRRGGSDA